jgi:thiol-disulfide isomerase/thioredoxin
MKKITLFFPLLLAASAAFAGETPAVKGGAAPELAFSEVVGGAQTGVNALADLKGRAVVLEFWSKDFEPCVENIPHLNELAAR